MSSVHKTIDNLLPTVDILAIIDNDKNKQGNYIKNIKVISTDDLFYYKYNKIHISSSSFYDIKEQLHNLGIPQWKISVDTNLMLMIEARSIALKNISQEIYRNTIDGAVAELSVFRGEFAQKINKFFPDRIFLFI